MYSYRWAILRIKYFLSFSYNKCVFSKKILVSYLHTWYTFFMSFIHSDMSSQNLVSFTAPFFCIFYALLIFSILLLHFLYTFYIFFLYIFDTFSSFFDIFSTFFLYFYCTFSILLSHFFCTFLTLLPPFMHFFCTFCISLPHYYISFISLPH